MNKVLVVEDEDDLRRIIASYLRQEGFGVVEAADGEEALERFADGEYSLVLLDLMLPKLGGYEVCKDIRQYSNVPIVILTARDGELDELKGFN